MKKIYTKLFEPMKIGAMEIKNRIIMAPMGIHSKRLVNHDGSYTNDGNDYFMERAKGGVGLIITGAMQVQSMFEVSHDDTNIARAGQEYIDQMKPLTEGVHAYDCKIVIQLTAGTGRNSPFWLSSGEPISASDDLPNVWKPETKHRALTIEEIQVYIDGFAKGAAVAKKAGFDGVEIHAIHEGYLLDQFSMACTNTRKDQYGGDLENRLRFAKEIVEAIKSECGQDFPVMMRYSIRSMMKGFNQGALPGEEFIEFGRDLEESGKAAKLLQDFGYDAIDADNGTYDSWWWPHPPVYMPDACNLEDCKYIKKFVDIPVICAGKMDIPELGETAIEAGDIDAIALARPLLADPYWPEKVKNGDIENIRPCIACHVGCLGRLFQGKDMCCALNPTVCREKEYEIEPAEELKNILVIGGGIAGMEAARVTALRGHQVNLFEKSAELGGVFIPASEMSFKEADKRLISWYKKQMENENITVHLNTQADVALVNQLKPDLIYLATGATSRALKIPGADAGFCMTAVEALLKQKPIGEKVAIIGGGLTGIEIAYELAKKGKQVEVFEMKESILDMPDLCAANALMLHTIIEYYKIPIHKGVKVEKIDGHQLFYTLDDDTQVMDVDTVISSIGYISNKELYDTISEKGIETHLVGDSNEVSNLLGAIWNSYELAMHK